MNPQQAPNAHPAAPAWLTAAPTLFLLMWASGFVFVKLGLRDADPLTFLALRYALVVAIQLVAFAWIRPALPATPRAWGNLIMVGLMLQAGYFACVYLSLNSGMSASAVSLITSQQPILVGLLAPLMAHERVGLLRWSGLVLGVGGASLVILSGSPAGVVTPLGVFFSLVALLTLTVGTLWEKRYGQHLHPVATNLVQCAVALAVCAPLAILLEPMRVHWSASLAGSLLYLALVNSIIAMTLLLAMIRHGEASRISGLFFLVPPATVVIAFVVLGEGIPMAAWPGMVLAVAGIYLVMRR